MRYEPGCAVAEYHIVEKVASSGVDELFRVENRGIDQTDLLRVVCRSVDDQRAQGSLQDSARQAALQHPNIAKVRQAFCHQGDLLIASEFVDGPTLRQLLDRAPLPLETAISYARQILSALAHAHYKGVFHGALSPDHVHITGTGQVKLNGFRLASDFVSATPAQGPHYMAPERFSTSNDPPTAQSDIYSCGILLYELLTGRKPFDASNAFQLRMLHAEAVPLPPARLCDGLPPDADRAILCALSKRPHDRFASATSFRDAFEGKQPARRIPKTGFAVACAALVALGAASAVLARYLDGSIGVPAMPAVAIQQMPFPVGLYASAPAPARLPLPAPPVEQPEEIEDPVTVTASAAPAPVQRTSRPASATPARAARSAASPQLPVPAVPQPTLAAAAAIEAPPATPRPPLKAKIYGAITDDPLPPPVAPRPQPQPVTSASLSPAVTKGNEAPVEADAAGPTPVPAPAQPQAEAAEEAAPQFTFTVNRTNPKPEKGFWRGITRKVNPFRKREPEAPPRK